MSRSSMSMSAAFSLTTLLAGADVFEELHPTNTENCRIPQGRETLSSKASGHTLGLRHHPVAARHCSNCIPDSQVFDGQAAVILQP